MATNEKLALIGYTGFVGGNLKRQWNFTHFYNSQNFKSMHKECFERVVCAGLPGAKWIANKNPQRDWENMVRLQNVLKTVHARCFVLISTIDVYPVDSGKDEDFNCESGTNHPYGSHRLHFENFCRENFSNCTIIRLPGLFGEGLKKNIIFDLLNDNGLDAINPKSSFQFYDVGDLGDDIQKTLDNKIEKINLFTQPLSTAEILNAFFPEKNIGASPAPVKCYDLHTKHAHCWDKKGHYIQTKNESMKKLSNFIGNYNP